MCSIDLLYTECSKHPHEENKSKNRKTCHKKKHQIKKKTIKNELRKITLIVTRLFSLTRWRAQSVIFWRSCSGSRCSARLDDPVKVVSLLLLNILPSAKIQVLKRASPGCVTDSLYYVYIIDGETARQCAVATVSFKDDCDALWIIQSLHIQRSDMAKYIILASFISLN